MQSLSEVEQHSAKVLSKMITPLAAWHGRVKKQSNDILFYQPQGGGVVREISWQEADQEARQMAAYLRSLELPAGSRIGLVSKNCAHWIIADVAIMMAGHVSVPIYPNVNADMVSKVLVHSESSLVFVGKLDDPKEILAGVPEGLPTINLPLADNNPDAKEWSDIIAANQAIADTPQPDLDDLMTIVYTSGTTGNPKGVMHSYRSLGAAPTLTQEMFTPSTSERMLSYLPLSHVAERSVCEMGMFYYGYTLYFAESLDTFAEDLRRARPTIFFAVPRIWMKFQQQVYSMMPPKRLKLLLSLPIVRGLVGKKILTGMGLDQCRIALSGAAPISNSLMAFYQKIGLTICEVYGMSENFGFSHSFEIGETKVGYVGKSNPGVHTKIGDNGEILVKSPCNMLGYYKQPDVTAETLDEEGYVHTGDVGTIDDGYLKITGRTKEIFKTSKGKYVAPAPIENHLLNNPSIEQICVVGNGLGQPIALLNLAESAADQEGLIDELETLLDDTNKVLEAHERLYCLVIVSEVWDVDNGFMTPTLKIKRNVIDEFYGDKFEAWATAKKPVIDLR